MFFFDGTLEQSCKSLILNEYFKLTTELYPNIKNIYLYSVHYTSPHSYTPYPNVPNVTYIQCSNVRVNSRETVPKYLTYNL
jgi:hypothetical protein